MESGGLLPPDFFTFLQAGQRYFQIIRKNYFNFVVGRIDIDLIEQFNAPPIVDLEPLHFADTLIIETCTPG